MTQHPTDDLGLYALGLLDRDERAAIDAHLAACATCRRELAAHTSTVTALREGVSAPMPDLRGAIVSRHRRTWIAVPQLFAYAASLVLTVALVATVAAWQQDRAARDDYARALSAVASGGRVVNLAPQAGSAARGALVLAPDGSAYLVLQLPQPPAGKGYEAWVIRDGSPRAAGMAPSPTAGVVTMQLHDVPRTGDVAAITVEDAAGVQQPTSAPLLLGQL